MCIYVDGWLETHAAATKPNVISESKEFRTPEEMSRLVFGGDDGVGKRLISQREMVRKYCVHFVWTSCGFFLFSSLLLVKVEGTRVMPVWLADLEVSEA